MGRSLQHITGHQVTRWIAIKYTWSNATVLDCVSFMDRANNTSTMPITNYVPYLFFFLYWKDFWLHLVDRAIDKNYGFNLPFCSIKSIQIFNSMFNFMFISCPLNLEPIATDFSSHSDCFYPVYLALLFSCLHILIPWRITVSHLLSFAIFLSSGSKWSSEY